MIQPSCYLFRRQETFPFPVFPPYPRGVVRVLSMDVVRLLAKASQEVLEMK
jgi:hypothetical protein